MIIVCGLIMGKPDSIGLSFTCYRMISITLSILIELIHKPYHKCEQSSTEEEQKVSFIMEI